MTAIFACAGEERYVYPDVSVVCGPLLFDAADKKQGTILNPRLLVEVISPSTEAYDRGEKFGFYRQIESLQEYVLISQDLPRVEIYRRLGDGTWDFAA
jgi:Uma2 family endonuclease